MASWWHEGEDEMETKYSQTDDDVKLLSDDGNDLVMFSEMMNIPEEFQKFVFPAISRVRSVLKQFQGLVAFSMNSTPYSRGGRDRVLARECVCSGRIKDDGLCGSGSDCMYDRFLSFSVL